MEEEDSQVFNHGMEEGKPEEPLEEEEEARIARTRRKPKEPSLEERRVHRLTHLPYVSELVRGVC